MVSRLTAITLLLFACTSALSAQPGAAPTFGQVPDSLFSGSPPGDVSAQPFTYNLKRLDIHFEETGQSIVAVLRYYVRVKIHDASVQQAAVVGIPYYFNNDIEQVADIRGYTHQGPGPAQRVPLDPARVRTVNLNARYNVKEFTMPAVADGSVIEYAYTVRRRYIEELSDFYLAHQVPTEKAEVSITYPKYLRYRASVQNYDGRLNHAVTPIDTTSEVPLIFTFPQPEPVIRETWTARDIPAVRKEAYISTLDDYRGRIKFQLSEFGLPRQALENSWDFVVADIRRKQQPLARIAASRQARQLGQSIAAATPHLRAAQDSIFHYLNRRANYSGSKAPFSDAGEAPVLAGEPADQAAINQTLAAMLQGAGIEAYPLLISTRESGRINRSFPSFFQFNGQLVYSEIDGESWFMDASFPFSHPNLIPVEMYNQTGLLLRPDSYRWVEVQPEASAFSISVDIEGQLDRAGNLSGTLRARNAGYPARQIRRLRAEGADAAAIIRQAVLDGYPDARIDNARYATQGDTTLLQAEFSLQDYGVSFANGIEYPPMVVGYLKQSPFDESTAERDLPVTLDAPERLDLSYRIALPPGMQLARRPQDRTIRLPGAVFAEQYGAPSDTLNYQFRIDLSRRQFPPELYPRLRSLYRRWVELSNTQWRLVR